MAFGAVLPPGPPGGISGSLTHLQGEAVGGQLMAPEYAIYHPRGTCLVQGCLGNSGGIQSGGSL